MRAVCLGLPSGLQAPSACSPPGETVALGNHATPHLAAAGPLRPRRPVVTLEARQGQHRTLGGWTSLLKPAPLSSHQARRVRTGRGSPATSGVSTETAETHLEIILPRAARLLSSGHTAGAAVLLRPHANQPVGRDAAEEWGGALKGALGGGNERVLPGGGEVSAGLHTSDTQVYPVSRSPLEPCSEGWQRWREDRQEERQSDPGAWALESQCLLSAKTGGAAGGDWGPTALSWGLGAEGGALWEEDAAEKSCPHSLCPCPTHHVHGRKAQLGEKVQPGFEQPRAGGSSSPASPGSEELGERSCPMITAGPLWRGCCVTQESMPTPEPAETSSGKGLFADVTEGSGDEIPRPWKGAENWEPWVWFT